MKVYLSGISGVKPYLLNGDIKANEVFALESFYSVRDWQKPLIPKFASFLLDSGAFTFMSNAAKHGNIDWLSYVDRYCDFIIENDIRLFFELDIDKIKGLRYVEMLRQRIEDKTHRKPIPVWHIGRGKDYYLQMIKEYPYVAIGGIAAKEMPVSKFEALFPYMIGMAHKNGCKIHGLGYTKIDNLQKYRFDPVDSTTWTMGGQFGEVHQFKNGKIIRHTSVINNVKVRSIKDKKGITLHNFREWLKFQHYADKNL